MRKLWMRIWLRLHGVCPDHGLEHIPIYCGSYGCPDCIDLERKKIIEKKNRYIAKVKK